MIFKFYQIINTVALKIFFLILALLLFTSSGFAETYYVSFSTGDDGNDGLTSQTAFKTLAKVSIVPFLLGDSILLKRGDRWNEKLKLRRSGSPGQPITYGAYGIGPKPMITGVSTIKPSSWIQVGNTDIYYTSIGYVYGVFEDGFKIIDDNRYSIPDGGRRPGNPTLTGSGGDWYYDRAASRLYYRPTSGIPSDHKVQVTRQSSAIYMNGQSYINIEGIAVSYVGGGMRIESSNHISIDNCDISYTFEQGISIDSGKSIIAKYNNITKVGDGIYWMGSNTGPNMAANNTISYCNYVVGGSQYNNNDGHAIGMVNGDNFVARNNTVSYTNMAAIITWNENGKTARNLVIKDNIVFANKKDSYLKYYYGVGISVASVDANALTGTKIYRNIVKTSETGFKLFLSQNPGPKIFNNTVYDCNEGFRLKKANYWILKNNIVAHTNKYQFYEENKEVGTNNLYNYNLYYRDIPGGWRYRGSVLSQFKEWRAISNQDSDSIIIDPLFSSTDIKGFALKNSSPAINAATFLTEITSPTGSGTSFTVADGSYFYDGYGIPGETGEIIKTESGQVATIVKVLNNKITVDKPINWISGEGLALNYAESAPDFGAKQYGLAVGKITADIAPPKRFKISQ